MLSEKLLDGRLKLRHLTTIVLVAEKGTISGAARALKVAQPVVTRTLHEIESTLDVELFERKPRGVVPTIYGEILIATSRTVIAQVRNAGRQIEAVTNADAGRIEVGTYLAGSNLLLPRSIARVKAIHPHLTVVVRDATPDILNQQLRSGVIDLAIGRLTVQARPPLAQERLYDEPMLVVSRHEHPVHRTRSPSLAQLTSYPWVFPVAQTALRRELENVFLKNNLLIPENRVECTSILTLRQFVIETDALAVLPAYIAVADSDLRPLKFDLAVRRSVGVTRLSGSELHAGAEHLLHALRQTAKDIEEEMLIGSGDLLNRHHR